MHTDPKKLDIGPAELEWLACSLIISCPPEEMATLKDLFSGLPSLGLFEYPPGAEVLTEGGLGTDVFVVYSGSLSVHKVLTLEPELIGRLGKGDFFGEMSFLATSHRSATVRTEERCAIFRFSGQELAAVVSGNKALEARIKKVALERLSRNFEDIDRKNI